MSAHGKSSSVNAEQIPAQRDVIRLLGRGLTITRRQVEGSKKSKTRVAVALVCNADGSDSCEPFIIEHAKKPRCFLKKTGNQLGFYYWSDLKARIISVLFQEWLREFDDNMCAQRHNAVLLPHNASAHTVNGTELQSATLVFLSANTTPNLQPTDARIITSFKRRYRHRQLQHTPDLDEQGSQASSYMVGQLAAMKSRIDTDEQLSISLLVQMQQLCIRDLMDLDGFVCCAGEINTQMEAFTAAGLLSGDVDVAFLSTTAITTNLRVSPARIQRSALKAK